MISAQALVDAGNKTVSWAAERLNADGTFTGVEERILAYYKAPMTLAEAGRVGEATAISRHLRDTFFEGGDFHAVKDDPTAGGLKNYRNAWIGRGLHQLGFYDLSGPAGDFLESETDPNYGGILADSAIEGHSREMDWGATCSTILSLLTMGRVDAAVRCGNFLVQMISDQPDADQVFLKRATDGRLIVDLTDRPAGTHVIELGNTGQTYWYLGMSMTAFAGLLLATGDGKWKNTADKVYACVEKCDDELYTAITNGKVAWGSGAMYAATGDEKFGQLSKKIWTWVMDTQTDDGLWIRRPQYNSIDEQPLDTTIDTSLERACYMFQLAKTLAGGKV